MERAISKIGAFVWICIVALAFAFMPVFVDEAYAEETLTPTEGWQAIGTCEWQLDNTRCLIIRPIDKETNRGTLPSMDLFDNRPWKDSVNSIFKVKIEGTIKAADSMRLFFGCKNLVLIEGLSNIDTSDVTSFSECFSGCESLTSVDLSAFNTSKATTMRNMFYDCRSLTSLDVSSFDTSSVTDMSGMFGICINVSSLDLHNFDTSNVIDMHDMFSMYWSDNGNDYSDSSLMTLNISAFDTSNVEDMSGMFAYCSQLKTIDASQFDTSNVKYFGGYTKQGMFAGCSSLESLDVSNFNTSNTTHFGDDWGYNGARLDCGMFYGCKSLNALDLGNFDTAKAVGMGAMFAGCSSIKTLDLKSFDTWNVTSIPNLFWGCSSLESVNLSSFNTSIITSMSGMFEGCSSLCSLDLGNFDTSKVEYMNDMFLGCTSLEKLDISNFDTSRVQESWTGRTNVFDSALKELTVGAKYTIKNSFPNVKWYNSEGVGFKTSDIPVGVADTYTAAIIITSVKIAPITTGLLEVGASVQLEPIVEPSNTTESVYWYSSNEDVATVDSNGRVTAKQGGNALIYASAADSEDEYWKYPNDNIRIYVDNRVQEIILSEYAKAVTLSDGPFVLSATVSPAGVFNGAIAWSSTNASVASVDANGIVTPHKVGTAKITASAGGMSAQCQVTVLESSADIVDATGVAIDKSSIELSGKASTRLTATVSPADATYKNVVWSSSNEKVARVSSSGEVTSVGKGAATITATSQDGKASATCQATVLNPPTSVTIEALPMVVKMGSTYALRASVSGELAGSTESVSSYAWTSSDSDVASISGSGAEVSLVANSVGDASVTVSASYGGKVLNHMVRIEVAWPDPDSITISDSSKSVIVGAEPFTLTTDVKPAIAANIPIVWTSTDPSVASVDNAGLVTILKKGNAIITARAGNKSASCTVKIDARSFPTAEDSDLNGYIMANDSDTAEKLSGLRVRIDESERDDKTMVQSAALKSTNNDQSLYVDAFEIDLVEDDGTVKPWNEPDNAVEVHFALDDFKKQVFTQFDPGIHYVSEDAATTEAKNTWIDGDNVAFETTHFSTYALTATPKIVESEGGGNGSTTPATPNNTSAGSLLNSGDGALGVVAFALAGCCAAGAAAVCALRARRKGE